MTVGEGGGLFQTRTKSETCTGRGSRPYKRMDLTGEMRTDE